ncbi:MAG: hypothetical protein HW408_585 [Actinobacteria bacterium]|nr:hypothetical protein [Actinomycetota bacterium]
MQKVIVTQVDYVNKIRKPIGEIVERRKKYRPNNMMGLLVIARQKFSSNPQDAFQTALDSMLQYGNGDDRHPNFMISVE